MGHTDIAEASKKLTCLGNNFDGIFLAALNSKLLFFFFFLIVPAGQAGDMHSILREKIAYT